MHTDYADIRSRIPTPPLWWDEEAVPRYEPFHPRLTANIYARECALVEIACQNCQARFLVAFSRSDHRFLWGEDGKLKQVVAAPTLASEVQDGSLHYGDPPNTDHCDAGPTMNCDDLRVVEFWVRPSAGTWSRHTELEITFGRASQERGM